MSISVAASKFILAGTSGGRRPVRRPSAPYRRLRSLPTLARVAVGGLLILGGLLGFLPVLGFWMIPLGLAVILIDVPLVKRLFSRLRKAWRRVRESRSGG